MNRDSQTTVREPRTTSRPDGNGDEQEASLPREHLEALLSLVERARKETAVC